ncbi:unnamed protein product [Rotaria sordida]|uniref:Uncharacterized protein n=1 Tax=Rotaria sordida TaxID=392033 RepID=A0A819SFP9_9BILA|nr:unnamed protein product [Rotaria sordida]
MLCIHENSNECPCPNEDVPSGVTQSSMVILGSHDKSTSMSPLQTLTDEDSSIPSFSLGNDKSCSKENEYNHSSYISFAEVLKENYQLKKQIQFYKSQWMPKPTSSEAQASSKFTQSVDVISTNSIKTMEKKSKRKRKQEKIRRRLKLTKKQLKECKHDIDIRRTCRAITKCLYPDIHIQASMSISRMSNQQKSDIREYAKMLHPDQRHGKRHFLHNAIGNVFASQKQKQ